ncbi:MAG: formylglycine-generating enzyme family protein [Pseudomonadota bacterium]
MSGVIASSVACIALSVGILQSAHAASHGKSFRDCTVCPEMVVVPSGTFVMGSPATERGRDKDEDQHRVTIGYPFAVSKFPITWDEFEACARDGMCDGQAVETALRTPMTPPPRPATTGEQAAAPASRPPPYADHGRGNRPVVGVSWWDAQVFVGWLNKKSGKDRYRLLSEAEFEYAARSGTTTALWWGDEPSHDYANYGMDDGAGLGGAVGGRDIWLNDTSPVGSFPPNAFGLYDMYGNIYQWIEDCYESDSTKLPTDGSAVKNGNCATRGFRSNSFESNPHTMRSANRAYPYAPDTRGRNYLGFRVAKTLP